MCYTNVSGWNWWGRGGSAHKWHWNHVNRPLGLCSCQLSPFCGAGPGQGAL